MFLPRFLALFVSLAVLSGCSSFDRSDDAAKAKAHMIGMSREDVLACMGPAKKKAREGATEVWSYLSSDGSAGGQSETYKPTSFSFAQSSRAKSFCTVNVVMKDGVVRAIHYLGPTGDMFAKDEQCGYAVANCVPHGDE